MFGMFTSFDQDFVSDGVLMSTTRLVLAFVVFVDTKLFAFTNVFPVRDMFDV